MGITFWSIVVTFASFVAAVIYSYGTIMTVVKALLHKKPVVTPESLRVTVLKPMVGVDPDIEKNLQTFADLKAPEEFEVIFCIATEQDPAVPIARAFAQKYPQRFKVAIGFNPTLSNGKMAQLAVGLPLARNPLIWVSDANVETSQAFFEELAGTWAESKARDARPTLIHTPIVAIRGSGVGAIFERTHLASFLNPNEEMGLIVGEHIVVGKTIFFHRDDLMAVGGLEKYGNYLGEDYVLGRAFAQAGVVKRTKLATLNVIGHVDLSTWFKRHVRWGVIRKSVKKFEYFTFELCAYTAVPILLAAVGLMNWQTLLLLLVHRAFIDALNIALLTQEMPRAIDLIFTPAKEIAAIIAWAAGAVTTHVRWRDRDVRVGADSLLLPPEIQPAWPVAKRSSENSRPPFTL